MGGHAGRYGGAGHGRLRRGRDRVGDTVGYGHTTGNNPSTCAIDDAVTYTLTGALPAPGTVCPQDGTPFPSRTP